MPSPLDIAGRPVGPGHPVYVIGEISANHGGRIETALALVDAIAAAGADAAKIQTYRADTMTVAADTDWQRVSGGTLWDGARLYDLYADAAMPWEWTAPLLERAADRGIQLFSTPFDRTAVDLLEGLGVPAYKVASFEIVDLDLIAAMADTGKPLIVSTGMASVEEIDDAVATAGGGPLALLRCNSAYPAPSAEMDLRTIPDMAARWGVPVGLSDHTLGTTAAVAGVALGACLVEKHVTLSRRDPTPDAAFSAEPDEFAAFVAAVREAEAILGSVRYGPSPSEHRSLAFRRSLVVVATVEAGETFTADNVRSLRPGHGLPPKCLPEVLGRKAVRRVEPGTPLSWDLVDGS